MQVSWNSRPAAPAVGALVALCALGMPAAAQAPGEFTVDEEAAERALERALVQTGSVVLPAGSAEIVPFLRFQRSEDEIAGFPALVNGELVGTSIGLDRNEFTAGIIARTGLPWGAQIDVTLPFTYADRAEELRVLGGSAEVTSSASHSGLGDVGLAYTQTLREESGGFPSLLGSVTWDTDTGDEEDGLFLGSGFNELGVALTATQRQDPLVFSGRIGYQYALEKNDIRPGDELSFAAAAFLAVNPETSLQFGLSLAYANDAEIDGDSVAGSDQLSATLDLGLATILRRNALLDAVLSVGVTDDAPDFTLAVNLPLRFTY